MTAALSQRFANSLLRVPEPVHQLPISGGLFDWVQIGTLDILDDRDFQHFRVIVIADHRWHFMQLRCLSGTPAPFTGDNLISS